MSNKINRNRTKAAIVAAVLLGIGATATSSLAGDYHPGRYNDRGMDEAQIFGQIIFSLLGASQPQAVHYYRPAPPPHPRRAWNSGHGARDCSVVTRVVTDRYGRTTRVVTRRCDDDHRDRNRHHWR